MAKGFYDLPFIERPDLSPYLIHLTKGSEERTAFENLIQILKQGILKGSDNSGFIKGNEKATCFMDIPFGSLKYVLTKENRDPDSPRYEPFGIFMTKKFAYKAGARPVMYLSNSELQMLGIPKNEQWRVVRFEVDKDDQWISWLHEREWRCKGDIRLPSNCGVVVNGPKNYKKLSDMINEDRESFAVKPHSILPLWVICQGFLK